MYLSDTPTSDNCFFLFLYLKYLICSMMMLNQCYFQKRQLELAKVLLHKMCQNMGFLWRHIFLYKDLTSDSDLIREYTDQRKPIFWHILGILKVKVKNIMKPSYINWVVKMMVLFVLYFSSKSQVSFLS